jgi:hypothetical protein
MVMEGKVHTIIAEPDRGRRHWTQAPDARGPSTAIAAACGGSEAKRLLRRRGEYVERSFAHVYDTGGMRRTHLRGHSNILKRLLVHASACNLGILMRQVFGRGTPRGLQGHALDARSREIAFAMLSKRLWVTPHALLAHWWLLPRVPRSHSACAIA